MADIDVLPLRGVPVLALVDSLGIASNGSQTVAQLAAKGVRSICAVDATGVSVSGATVAQLAAAGIRAFCPVDELGVAQDSSTADTLRARGIRPMVLLGATGIALTGSATMLTLAQRKLGYFCPVDESGNATTMGAVILVTNTTVLESATIGTTVGTLSVAGGTGTYTFTLTGTGGGKFTTGGTNGVNLNTAAALDYETATSHSITISATNGGTPITRTVTITVIDVNEFAPVITSNGGGASASVSVAENSTAVTTVTATDADASAVITYSISGGADAAKFAIGSSTGVLTFVSAPDFETPTDADLNNAYIVIVQASDGTNTDTQTITVTVTNVVEPTDPIVIGAPVLTWTSGVTDNAPNFNVDLPSGLGAPMDAEAGDIIYLEIADNISFTTTSTDTLDAGDVSGDIVAMEQGTPLSDGTYYARARLKRGTDFGPYSNTETKTIDATAPTITSSASVSLVENAALSHSLTADETVTWTKTGGADTALFSLAGSTLSMTAKNFESPADADANNTYIVQVTATDAAGNATNQTVTVTVTDVVESTAREFAVSPGFLNATAARSYITAFGYLVEL